METAQEVDTFQSTTLKQGAALQKQDGKSLKREEKGKEENSQLLSSFIIIKLL